jgi:hypothetical protein
MQKAIPLLLVSPVLSVRVPPRVVYDAPVDAGRNIIKSYESGERSRRGERKDDAKWGVVKGY